MHQCQERRHIFDRLSYSWTEKFKENSSFSSYNQFMQCSKEREGYFSFEPIDIITVVRMLGFDN